MAEVTITCPHCSYARVVPAGLLPQGDVSVTCPRCRKRFPLSCGTGAPPESSPPQPAVSAATPVSPTAASPAADPAVENWHMSSQYRHLLIVLIVMFMLPLLLSSLLMLRPKLVQLLYLQGAIQLVLASIVITFICWRIKTPLFQLNANGIRIRNTPFRSGQTEAAWKDLIGFSLKENMIFGVKNIQLRLLLGRQQPPLRELTINPKIVGRQDELVMRLRERLPTLTAELLTASGRLGSKGKGGEVRFGSHILSRDGIAASRQLIPWGAVCGISTPQLVLAGYGGLTIDYTYGAKPARLTVAAKMTSSYQEFVRTLLLHAPQAIVDPGVAKILDCPPEEAKKESLAILLLVLGLVLTLAAVFLTVNYEPVVSLKAACALLTAATGIIPLAMAMQLFVGKLQGKAAAGTRLLSWSGAVCGGPLASLVLLFLFFPSARYALGGDIALQSGNLDKAAHCYRQALNDCPDNLDARFALGMVYLEKKDYEGTFDCLRAVYEKDSKNWQIYGIEIIPDSLLKLGRYDEAIQWCDRIAKDHPRWRSAVTAMESKKREIDAVRTKATL